MVATSFLGFMGIFEMGIGASTVKYLAEYVRTKDKKGISSIVFGSIVFYLIFGTILSISMYYFSPIIIGFLNISSELSFYTERCIKLIALGFFPMLFTNFNMAVFMGLQRYEVSNIVGLARSGLTQIIAVIIVFLGGRVFEVLMGSVLVLWGCAILSSILAIRMLIPHGLGFFFPGFTAGKYTHFQPLYFCRI